MSKQVAMYNPLFIEDPVAPANLDVMASIAKSLPIPMATGECCNDIYEFEQLFRRDVSRYIRPDLCTVGGITAGRKIAAIAEANCVLLSPRNLLGPVSTAAALQLDAAIENFLIQEFPSSYTSGGESGMLKEPLVVDKGYIKVPDGPGLGIELIDNIEKIFPKIDQSLSAKIAYDGSIYGI